MTTSSETIARTAPVRPRSASGVATAVLLATAPASGGGPAALQPWEDGTLLGRLLDQLAVLGVGDLHVVTRPGWALEGVDAAIHVSATPADDLRIVAEIAERGQGGLVAALGDIVAHREALAGLLDDPRLGTAVLTGRAGPGRRFAPRVREQNERVASAGSPYHTVHHATGAFLGVLQVGAVDRAALAAVARRLAGLSTPTVPAGWQGALERKTGAWRGRALPEERLRDELAALPQDVVSLLVTGLVRSGVDVRSSHLRRLAWARPLSHEAVAAAAERFAAVDEDRLHLDSAVKPNDGFFTTFFVSSYSRFIARWAARRGLTPNQVTSASAAIGLLAAAAFAVGERWGLVAGAVLLQVSFTLDCVDGQLARYTRNFSAYGAWLDSIFDRTKEYAVFAGLAHGAGHAGDDVWLLAGCALTLQTVRHMLFVGFRDSKPPPRARPQPPIEQPSDRPGGAHAVEDPEPVAPEPVAARRPPGDALRALLRRLHRVPGLVWARRLLEFPIGERFAAISLCAALFTPRTTFVVLLVGGGVAGAYTAAVRVARSIAGAARHPRSLAVLRDDGPLARALGRVAPFSDHARDDSPIARAFGRAAPLTDLALVTAAAVVLFAVVAAAGDGASNALAGAVVACVVLCAGAAGGARAGGRLRWTQLPLLRLCEYGALLWLAALAGPSALPAAMALLVALAFRHYDIVYRVRLRGATPGRWVSALAGGWDGRLVAAYVLLLAGALPAALYVAAAVLGAAFVADAVLSWTAPGRPPPADDAEDDD